MLILIFLLMAIGVIAGLSMLVVGIVLLCRHLNKVAGILLTIFGGILSVVMIYVVLAVAIAGIVLS